MGRPGEPLLPALSFLLPGPCLPVRMPRSATGLAIVVAGVVIVLVGLLVWTGALSWFGRLPGDIRVERPNMRMYIPITSMLLLSVVISVVLAIVRRFR